MKQIPYATQWIDTADIQAVNKVLKSAYLTQGPVVEEFEKKIAEYCGAKYAVAVNSGTSALHIACLAAGISSGDEVVTSPITFAASANCVLYCGARPVFADINEETICLDVNEIAKKLSPKTKAIIPVDFAGHPADLAEIHKLARERGLVIIEDAAHAIGARYRGEKIGSGKYADMTALSFHAVKHITTGEGGMVLTNREDYYRKLKLFRTHGISRDLKFVDPWYYEMKELGFNYRLSDIQCALGLSQLKKLPHFLSRRKQIVTKYNEAFSVDKRLSPLVQKPYVVSANHLYVLQFDSSNLKLSRSQIFNEYRRHGILVNVHYLPVYWHLYYKKLGYCKGFCPKAERYYEKAITLPLYPKMSDQDVKRVIRVTEKIMKMPKRGMA